MRTEGLKGVLSVLLMVLLVSFLLILAEAAWGQGPPPSGDTYDVDAMGIPKFVRVDYIELEKIYQISRFRSGVGHDFSDDFESCRSMKHYFEPKSDVDWSAIKIFSPVKGTVSGIFQEWAGTQVQIKSEEYPAFDFIIFHVNLANPLNVGDAVTAGQQLGTHIGSQTMSDIAVGVNTPRGWKLVSYFDVIADSIFQNYQACGVSSRDAMIISKEARDADPLTCIGETFTTSGNLANWVTLVQMPRLLFGDIEWIRQFGTSMTDRVNAVAVDTSGNVYIAGLTWSSSSGYGAFVGKYDSSWSELWTRAVPGVGAAQGMAVDTSGNVYVAGDVIGALPGQSYSGGYDVFVRKYDGSGSELWTRQFGSPANDYGKGAAVDVWGNVYLIGYTNGALPGQLSSGAFDAFVRKYDGSGNELWTRQFGTSPDDHAHAVAVDTSGNVYVAGSTESVLPGQSSSGYEDAFVRKYDGSGNELWTKQFGSSASDLARGVAIDTSGNVYVSGLTRGALPGQTSLGGGDAFVRKYDNAGNELWTRQFGTSDGDSAGGVAIDTSGNVYVSGSTQGALPVQTSSGYADAFVRKYDNAGNELWTRQFGSSESDVAHAVAVDTSDNVYVAGETWAALPGQSYSGSGDAFLVKFVQGMITAPSQSQLYLPPDGTYMNDITPYYEWALGTNAYNHRLLVDNDPDFTSPEENVLLGATDNTYTPTAELADENYSWKVIAINVVGENESTVWTFTIDTAAPAAPSPLEPAYGSLTNDNTPTFKWNSLTDPSGLTYTIQVDNDSEFTSTEVNVSGLTGNTYTPSALADENYLWRVRAVDGAGNSGDWSMVWTLLIDTVAPAAPSLLDLADGSLTNDNTPTFGWTEVIDTPGVTYTIQVDNDSDFSSPEVNVSGLTENTYTPPVLADENYSWRVRAVDGANNAGGWSTNWTFVINTVPLAEVSIPLVISAVLIVAAILVTVYLLRVRPKKAARRWVFKV